MTMFNAGDWLVHRHVREGRGDRVAVRGGVTLTYAQLSDLVATATAALRALGLRRDDRVVFVTSDGVPMFAGILAAFCGGFVAVPVSTMLGAKELGAIIADSGAAVVVAGAEYAPQVQEALSLAPEVRHVVWEGDPPPGSTSLTWEELLRAGGGERREPAPTLEPRRPAPAVTAERMAADRPTLFFAVPTFYAALLAADLPAGTFASVRLGASAGEALPAPLQERFTGRFGVEIIDGIGSTEALHIFLSNRPGDVRPGTTGRPVPGYDIELRDPDGRLVADGEPGALHVRGESIALGYWRRTDASRAVFAGRWLNTGDTYTRSPEGYYTCLGRSNDLLKAGGIWVSPAEVESRLLEHPAVLEAAVVGVADEHGLDKPVACVVAQGQVTAEELVQWCRDGLAAFKRPRRVVFLDRLPKTATGKIQRFRVRELLAEEARA
ncbi:AMP-binding protein [Nonomuraea sp. NPDC052116]|uniref:AMP-binding protein n=1 Tax=Nonomuraea sp. NPDC052116 TaxID=3155665 RepID=UPI00341F6D13